VTGLRALAVGLVTIFVALVLGASPAAAHAELVSTSPAADSVLATTPDAIVLTFSEMVDPVERSIELVDARGETVVTGPVDQDRGHDTLAVEVVAPLDGSYVVSWRAVSADSHPIGGAFTFAVGTRSDVAPGLLAGGSDFDAPAAADAALAIGRFLGYGAVAVLVGGYGALARCDRRLLRRPLAARLLVGAAVLGVVASATMILAQAAIISTGAGDPDAWVDVIRSAAGRWWFARVVAFGVAAVVVHLARRVLDRAAALVAAAVGGLALLAIVAAGGHAVTGRWEAAGFAATVLHLAAMSLWVGGLVAVVLVGRRSPLPLVPLLMRFSPLALASVVVVALTGTVNAWRQLGSADELTSSSYGRWLIIKSALVVVVVLAALVNRRVVRRRAADVDGTDPRARPPLGRTLGVELVGMVAVLVATTGLVGSPPPLEGGGLPPVPVSVTAVNGDAHVRIDLFPAATTGTALTVTLSSHDGSPQAADEITVTASLPARDLGPIAIETDQIAPNVATADDATFPLPGTWDITVTARFGEFDQLVFTHPVEVRSAR
jgi:copper transport protein